MRFSTNRWALFATIIVVGSIWGLFEMTLGGFLHAVHFPQKGAIMGGLAISFMAIFVTITRKPSLVPILGVIAASFKLFDAIIFRVPLLSPYVVNPATAIIMEALAFSAVTVILKAAMEKHLFARASAGILAGFLGYASYAVFASMLGWGKWPTLDFMAKLKLILTSAAPIGIAGAVMLVVGFYVGTATLPKLSTFREAHPKLYYSASLALVLLCWVIPIVL